MSKLIWQRDTAPLSSIVDQLTALYALIDDLQLIAITIERERVQQVDTRLEATHQNEQLKSALLDALAHEFKTPLWACPHFWHKELRLNIHRRENLSHGVITPEIYPGV